MFAQISLSQCLLRFLCLSVCSDFSVSAFVQISLVSVFAQISPSQCLLRFLCLSVCSDFSVSVFAQISPSQRLLRFLCLSVCSDFSVSMFALSVCSYLSVSVLLRFLYYNIKIPLLHVPQSTSKTPTKKTDHAELLSLSTMSTCTDHTVSNGSPTLIGAPLLAIFRIIASIRASSDR